MARTTYSSDEKEQKARERTLESQNHEVEELFRSVADNNEIGYFTMQLEGVEAHAQIVFDAEKRTREDGRIEFYFKTQDSNYQDGNYEVRDYQKKSFTSIKYFNGIWHMKSQGSNYWNKIELNNKDYKSMSVHMTNRKKLKKINELHNHVCGRFLFEDDELKKRKNR